MASVSGGGDRVDGSLEGGLSSRDLRLDGLVERLGVGLGLVSGIRESLLMGLQRFGGGRALSTRDFRSPRPVFRAAELVQKAALAAPTELDAVLDDLAETDGATLATPVGISVSVLLLDEHPASDRARAIAAAVQADLRTVI